MIDWNRISELQADIGADEFDEIVCLFLEEVETEIDDLRSGAARDNLEAQLHFLKGSALNLGFSDFAGLCQSGETAAAQGCADQVDLNAIVASYEQSRVVFAAGCKTPIKTV